MSSTLPPSSRRQARTGDSPRRPSLNREEILRVSAQIFREKGFRATSLQEVADHFGVRRPAIYYWFPSKVDILVEIHRRFFAELTTQLERVEALDVGADEKLASVLTGQVELFAASIAELAVFIGNEVELPDDARREAQLLKRRYQQALEKIYATGVAEGMFAALDPHIAINALLGMTNWMYRWYRQDGTRSADEIAEIIKRLACHGYLVRPAGGIDRDE